MCILTCISWYLTTSLYAFVSSGTCQNKRRELAELVADTQVQKKNQGLLLIPSEPAADTSRACC